jgi:hypothetical protein
MATDSTLQVVIEAKNNTGNVFNEVKDGLNGIKTSNESTAMSIFKGVASWDLLKTAVKAVTGFIKESIEASAKAQAEMAMVRNNVENAGMSYDSIKDKLDAYSKSMIQMGFDDEETATSVSKLMLVTKDYDKALTLNQLAGDLARNSNQSMEETTRALTMALGGNIRTLKLYVPELKAGASAAEVLSAVHEKVKNSMTTFAATTEGKMQIMKVTYTNFKEQIGDVFGPALNIALTNFNNFLNAANNNAGVASESIASKLQRAFAVAMTGSAWKAGLLDLEEQIINPIEKVGNWVGGLFGNKVEGNAISDSINKTINGLDEQTNATVNAATAALKLQKAIDAIPPSYAGMGTAGEDSMKAQKDAMKGVLDKLKDFKQSIEDIHKSEDEESQSFIRDQIEKNQSYQQQLADMIASHKEKWTQANKDLADLQKNGIQNPADLQKMGELQRTAESEFNIIQPYLNDTNLNNLAQTSDVERLITAHRAEQGQATVDEAKKMQDFQDKAQQIYINFDLKDTTITDDNFINKIKSELNKTLNTLRYSN